ncbi:hypothetical protein R3W88_015883 [Solanum pinnatisectum]|uniref:DUF4283 domain-containing protein n=1 Tax=Solanum pinnatisectum TaxID=50273 RepID=A0AAV9KYX3_9SOLN|nr:hypothetical protein R3W88_015883 [Solanum pinnatisectum]
MASTIAGGSVPPKEFPPLPTKSNHESQTTIPQNITEYATLLKPKPIAPSIINVPPKPVFLLHGEPSIMWKTSEVRSMIVKENLQYAIVGKFSYSKPEIKELRKVILGQCGVKSECTIDLPLNFFAKEAIFSIAITVGKPLTVDIAIKNQTRPSYASVKIEVDLMAKLPQRIRINEEDDNTGVVKFKWVKVQYDYMPKYGKECCLQGHDEHTCWTIHPELYEENKEGDQPKEEWDVQTLMAIIATKLVEYIIGNIKRPKGRNEEDIPCWMLETKGNFSVKTAWNYIRHREEPNRTHKWI